MAKHTVTFNYHIDQRVLNIYNEKEGTIEMCALQRENMRTYLVQFDVNESYWMVESQISEIPILSKESIKFKDEATCDIKS